MVIRILSLRPLLSQFRVSYTTFKSKNDEGNNRVLLDNLKNISLLGGRKVTPTPQKTADEELVRNVDLELLERIGRYHISDPILYNYSVLSRVFHIPEEYVKQIVWYVRPIMYYAHSKIEKNEPLKLHTTSIVIDLARLKNDDRYLVDIKKVIFPKLEDETPNLDQKNKIDVIK